MKIRLPEIIRVVFFIVLFFVQGVVFISLLSVIAEENPITVMSSAIILYILMLLVSVWLWNLLERVMCKLKIT